MDVDPKNIPFKDTLSSNTTGEEFEGQLAQFISPDDAEILGSKAKEKLLVPVLLSATFAAGPDDSFNRYAIESITGDDFGHALQEKELDAVIGIIEKMGLYEKLPNDRYRIKDTELQAKIKDIYRKNNERWTQINYGE